MTNETLGKLFIKVASYDKSARLLAGLTALRKAAAIDRKQEVQTKVASIMKKALNEQASSEPSTETPTVDLTPEQVENVVDNAKLWGVPSAALGGAATGIGAGVMTNALLKLIPGLKDHKGARLLLSSIVGVPAGLLGGAAIGTMGAGYGGFRQAGKEIQKAKANATKTEVS